MIFFIIKWFCVYLIFCFICFFVNLDKIYLIFLGLIFKFIKLCCNLFFFLLFVNFNGGWFNLGFFFLIELILFNVGELVIINFMDVIFLFVFILMNLKWIFVLLLIFFWVIVNILFLKWLYCLYLVGLIVKKWCNFLRVSFFFCSCLYCLSNL